jgi:hypothetical protein
MNVNLEHGSTLALIATHLVILLSRVF